jgi:hypothetical protein
MKSTRSGEHLGNAIVCSSLSEVAFFLRHLPELSCKCLNNSQVSSLAYFALYCHIIITGDTLPYLLTTILSIECTLYNISIAGEQQVPDDRVNFGLIFPLLRQLSLPTNYLCPSPKSVPNLQKHTNNYARQTKTTKLAFEEFEKT